MRRDRLERALYDLTTNRSTRRAFESDPTKALGRYHLDEHDRGAITQVDVKALADAGVNAMLTWSLWLALGGGSRSAYLAALRGAETTS